MEQGKLSGREAAFLALSRAAGRRDLPTRELEHLWQEDAAVDPRDRRLATELVYGLVRRKAALDRLIASRVHRPRKQIEQNLWLLLQLGTYQLAFVESIPAHAAVHETVELCRRRGQLRWCNFLNGVLRSIDRMLLKEHVADPSADALPLRHGLFRKLSDPIFPEPSSEPQDYFAQAFSFPLWMIRRWMQRFDFKDLLNLGHWFNATPRLCLRVNFSKTTREELITHLNDWFAHEHALPQKAASERSFCTAGRLPCSVWLDAPVSVIELPGFHDGSFTVQDESAMHAGLLLDPRPGGTVLDLCAAPGTKTTHLAELMKDCGTIVATDVSSDRLERVKQNAARLGFSSIVTQSVAADGADVPDGPFDAVLVDAPCSNTGVLGKRPEVRWRLRLKDLSELHQIQSRLLDVAVSRVRRGGRIVYSTCSIEPEENERVVEHAVTRLPVRLADEYHWHPGQPGDGGYQALLSRTT